MNRVNGALVLAVILTPLAYADEGSFTNSGGSTSVSSGVAIINSTVASPAGTLNLTCPQTSTGACAGGSFSYVAGNGTTVAASFTSGKFAESCSGGGKGGHVTCSYSFTGYFSGALTAGGRTQGIIGVTYQSFGTGGAAATGTTGYNSAYAPFYYSDSEQILRSDDLMGTNQITYGSQGSGIGNFYGAYGIALDSAGRIYVADTYNCRVVRIDNMLGANWTTYPSNPTCGAGQGQFYDPSGIAVDSSGKIYVMDTGNSRLVGIDDMNGTNWTSFGSAGSGANQFASFASVAVDSANHIYVADTGNRRIVRMDDMKGTNWTVLTQSPPVNGVSYTFYSPVAVAVDAAGKIYVADNEYLQPAVVRVDDMTGANWISIYTGANSGGLNSISVDSGGTVFTGGGGVRFVDNQAAVLTSSGMIGPVGSYYVFGVTPVPVPSPRPPAIAFTPPALTISQNLGGTSAPQNITVSNLGGGTLNVNSASANSPFAATNDCASVAAGASCAISVAFTPAAAGTVNGTLTVTDDSGNLGGTQSIPITGTGTAPAATISPSSLSFGSQIVGTTSAAKSVTVQSSGTGPLQVTNVTTAAPFSQTNNCSGSFAPGAFCTIQVSFTPAALGPASGTLTIADTAGTQVVNLSGMGSGPVSLSPRELDFGTVAVGTTSAAQTVTLTNGGSVSVTGVSIGASAGFAISSTTCGTSVAAGANCTIAVTFAPKASGSVDGTLTVTDSALGSPQTASLTGIGGALATVAPGALNFGSVAAGTTSAAQTVTLTNGGSTSINISGITPSASFGIASTTCGGSLNGGANCTVNVTFSPTATGTIDGMLTFTDSAFNGPQVVSLTGSGYTTATVSPTSLSFGTIRVGHTSAPKTVTLTNSGGVAFSSLSATASAGFAIWGNTCSTSLDATCTFSVTFTPTVKGTINGTLTITDSAANSLQVVALSGTGK